MLLFKTMVFSQLPFFFSHFLKFELLSVTSDKDIEMVIWGPYPTTISKIIGETVGVVRGEEFAIGLQALNPKTLGGYPWNDNDCMPQLDIFENEDYSDLSEEGKRYVLYRVEAAKPEEFGSSLQAYCRNREKDRITENWNHDQYLVPAYDDGGVIGSAIALFGCPVNNTLDALEQIEISEDLPHPFIDGVWGKKSPTASSSYLILGFGEDDIDKAIAYTKQAGLDYLYHPGPFETWGHFKLNAQFPGGKEGLKNCVMAAEEEGIFVGVHTLSNFITTNDAYVTPVPDERLAKVGSTILTQKLLESDKELFIQEPTVFRNIKNNSLKTVLVGNELIRYGSVSDSHPWKLLDCQRGAYGTTPANHKKGVQISLLADHAYKVFLTNADLTKEVAVNIADLYNETGLRQISFDGLEGNRSTGMGNYGEILMATSWYDNLNDDVRSHFIADASRTSHYFWHIYTRMNWGEPWYAGFRESQTEYRFKNQAYFERNLMPGMLGWFLMTETTSLEDIEWMLAKAAGYHAGFGFVSNYEAFEKNGITDEILQQIKTWEEARISGVFNEEEMQNLRDTQKEFQLQKMAEKEWKLTEIHSFKMDHIKKEKQPGEPVFSSLTFNNPGKETNLQIILTAVDGDCSDISLEMDNYRKLEIPKELKEGQIMKFGMDNKMMLYSDTWQLLLEQPVESFIISPGEHKLILDADFNKSKDAVLKLEVRMEGEVRIIR